MDCNAERLGAVEPLYEKADKRINIDHHISNTGSISLGKSNPNEINSAATCKVCGEVLEYLKTPVS